MDSRDRIISALKHNEPDKVLFDLGGTSNTGIHVNSYRRLLSYLKINKSGLNIRDIVQQLAYLS
jgi:uroporphyrinogen decarboxylase